MADNIGARVFVVDSIELDAEYAGFKFSGIKDNEQIQRGLGYTFAYSNDRDEATIYVYTKGQHDIPDGPMSETVIAEFNEATREVLARGQFTGEKIEIVNRYGTGYALNLFSEIIVAPGAHSST